MDYILKDHVRKVKIGDDKAAEELLIKLKPLILSNIRKYAREGMDWEELLQEGYLEVLHAVYDFDERKGVPFLGYIKLRLKYFYLNYIRGERIIYDSLNDSIDGEDGMVEVIDMVSNDSPDILENYIRQEEEYELGKALKNLTEKQRKIIDLYFFKGLSMIEIARKLNIHYMSVVKLKNRAVQKLKEQMDRSD